MSRGFSTGVFMRLWSELCLIRKGETRSNILDELKISSRQLSEDLKVLKGCEIDIRYRKSNDTHVIDWPSRNYPLDLDEKEIFVLLLVMNILNGEEGSFQSTIQKIHNSLDFDEGFLLDLSSGSLSNTRVNEKNKSKISSAMNAIRANRKMKFRYQSKKSGSVEEGTLGPIRVIHTPMSYYLYAYCENTHDYRLFKFTRIESLRALNEQMTINHEIPGEAFKDSWYVVTGGEVKEVKVIFRGPAAQSIKEYQLHSSQKIQQVKDGTEVSWRLCERSMMTEFATWLMGWTPEFSVKSPLSLKNELRQRMEAFLDRET